MTTFSSFRDSAFENIPFFHRVVLNRFQKYREASTSGLNQATTGAEQDIWIPGTILQRLTTAETMNIASTSVNDTLAGTGAQIVFISGLSENYTEISETLSLQGTTNVPTTQSYLRVLSISTIQAGTTESNEGVISATAATSATVQCSMAVGDNNSQNIQFTVPEGKVALLLSIQAGVAGGLDATFRLKSSLPNGGVYRTLSTLVTRRAQDLLTLSAPILFPSRTDVKITAIVVPPVTSVSGIMNFVLVDSREVK